MSLNDYNTKEGHYYPSDFPFFYRICSTFFARPTGIAILLTVIVFVLGIGLAPTSPVAPIQLWGDGFWNLLGFAMQMTLVLVTGHALSGNSQ